jgi:hypothetical protein
MRADAKYITEVSNNFRDYVDIDEIYFDYQKLFDRFLLPKQCAYDIVYCMGISLPWSPQQNDLGGSEQTGPPVGGPNCVVAPTT